MAKAACCLVDLNQASNPTCTNNPTCENANRACAACGGDNPDSSCKKMIQTAWPDHCVQGQDGDAGLRSTVKTVQGEIIVQKGENKYVDAYVPTCNNACVLYYCIAIGKKTTNALCLQVVSCTYMPHTCICIAQVFSFFRQYEELRDTPRQNTQRQRHQESICCRHCH